MPKSAVNNPLAVIPSNFEPSSNLLKVVFNIPDGDLIIFCWISASSKILRRLLSDRNCLPSICKFPFLSGIAVKTTPSTSFVSLNVTEATLLLGAISVSIIFTVMASPSSLTQGWVLVLSGTKSSEKTIVSKFELVASSILFLGI